MENELKKNKKRYMFYCISKQSLFIWPISLIYFRGIGLSFTEIMLLEAISGVVTFVCEVPSGIMADKFNRRKLIIYGEILNLAGLFIMLFFKNFYILACCSVLSGIGNSLVSGSDEALIYDSFKNFDETDSFQGYLSKTQMWSLRFYALTTLMSGALYKINTYIPIVLSIIIEILAIIFVCGMSEIRIGQESTSTLKSELRTQIDNIKEIMTNKRLIELFYIYIIMMIIISNINYVSQSFLTDNGIDYAYIGLVFFVFNIISSFGAKYAADKKLKSILIMLIYSVLLIGLCFCNIYIALMIFAVSRFINGMVWPILNSEINDKIRSENRATILSYKNLFVQISFIVFDPLVGVSLDKFGMRHTYGLMGIILFIVIVITVMVKISSNNKHSNVTSHIF